MARIGSIHWKKFESFLLEYCGCVFVRERGDHRVYTKNGLSRPIIIPRDTQLPPMVILNNLRTLGISRETYLEYFKKS